MALIHLRYVVLVHFFLSLWALYSDFIGLSYVISNLALAGVGCWAVASSPDLEPFIIYSITFIFTILNDAMSIGIYDDKQHLIKDGTSPQKFGMGMAILNLILKAFSIYLLYKEFYERMGGSSHDGGKSGYEAFPRTTAGSTAAFGPNYSNVYPQPVSTANAYQPTPNNYQPASSNYQPASSSYQPLGEGTIK